MQEFKPSNTRHFVQDIKGHAVLASSVLLTLITSSALVSHSNVGDYLIYGAKTSLSHLANQTPRLAINTLNSLRDLGERAIGNSPGSFEVTNLAIPQPGAPIALDIQFPGVTQAPMSGPLEKNNLAHNTDQQSNLSTSDYIGTTASPFSGQSNRNHHIKSASLSEIDNFLALQHERYTYVDNKYFLKNTKARLPRYQRLFEQAAAKHDLDWRLVAAIAYQESVWDPKAVSPTGVKGMMMLTRITAKEMGVRDRTDVAESIFGGAAYFKKLLDRVPAEVKGPNRALMALAAYNMGYGHLIAARQLTARQGADNTSWKQVKKRLPLLQQKKYYQQSRYGYARGARQAMHYVTEIQKHYDMLLMLTEHKSVKKGRQTQAALKGFELARYSYSK